MPELNDTIGDLLEEGPYGNDDVTGEGQEGGSEEEALLEEGDEGQEGAAGTGGGKGKGAQGTADGGEEGEEEPEAEDPKYAALMDMISDLRQEIKGKGSARPSNPLEDAAKIAFDSEISEDDFTAAIQTREGMKSVMDKVGQKAFLKAVEYLVTKMPEMVGGEVTRTVTLKDSVDRFYASAPDLVANKKFVSFVYNDLQAKNPDRSPMDIIQKDLAKEVRKRLGKKAPAASVSGKTKPTNTPTPPNGRRQAAATPKGVAAEIAKMMKI